MRNKILLIFTVILILIISLIIFLFLKEKNNIPLPNNQNNSEIELDDDAICKPLIKKGDPSEKINFIFIPAEEIENEQEMLDSITFLFDENKKNSFYTAYPFSGYKNDFNFFYLNWYDLPENLEIIKNTLKEKCPHLSKNLHQIISTGYKLGGGSADYTRGTSKIGYQCSSTFYKKSLHMFLHEIGHSFGGLGESYGQSFGDLASYRKNYNNNLNLAGNIDIGGCPKWCSGRMNTQSPCYQDYLIMKNCLLSIETKTNQEGQECINRFHQALTQKGIEIFPAYCNFGVDCQGKSNCWFLGDGYFRANDNDLMSSGGDETYDEMEKSYGPGGNEQVIQTVKLLKNWIQQKKSLSKVNLKILSSSIINKDSIKESSTEISVEFKLLDEKGIFLNLFTDQILDNVFYVGIKLPNYQNYNYIYFFNKVPQERYKISIVSGRSEKELPVKEAEIIFFLNLPNYKNNWKFTIGDRYWK